ncbi:MAG TPA: acetolactate synthase large subunit [Dissulfurispiraceae bacterium]|nr:acetolactate synthase large subunit [Dissulfurispiraceae bacterium]
MMKASDLFVRQLEEEGVEYIFGLPGEENLDFLESLRTSSIKVIITRHEQAAAFMAATYGRLTGKAGVCFSTLGPGATNLVTGIAHAQLIGAPLISISGQKALRENWQARFQLLNVVEVMEPITKKSVSIVDPATVPTILRNGFRLAETERPGAVHIELPEDVAESQTDAYIQKRGDLQRPAPHPESVRLAADLINKAQHPLIIISAGANRNRINEHLTQFIENTSIYAVHTQMGKGVLSDESPYSLYATGIHKRDYVNCGIDRADVIITIGYNIVEYPPFVWNSHLDKQIINIDYAEAEIDRYFNPAIDIVGDISAGLAQLAKLVIPRGKDDFFQSVRRLLDKKLAPGVSPQYPLTPQEVVWKVRAAMRPDDIAVFDNGIYKLWFSRLYRTYLPNTFLVDNALASMGAGLPSAIMTAMLKPSSNVLAIVGDGGFMMTSCEIETALRYKVPLTVLILNDNAFGFIKWKQQSKDFPSFALDYSNPDFVKYAESFGAVSMKVRPDDDLAELLKKAFLLKKLVFIECPIDYSPNYETFSKELSNIVCEI